MDGDKLWSENMGMKRKKGREKKERIEERYLR